MKSASAPPAIARKPPGWRRSPEPAPTAPTATSCSTWRRSTKAWRSAWKPISARHSRAGSTARPKTRNRRRADNPGKSRGSSAHRFATPTRPAEYASRLSKNSAASPSSVLRDALQLRRTAPQDDGESLMALKMIVILRRREAPSRRTQNHDSAILAQPLRSTRPTTCISTATQPVPPRRK